MKVHLVVVDIDTQFPFYQPEKGAY